MKIAPLLFVSLLFASPLWARCEDLAKGLADAHVVQNADHMPVGQDYDEILDRGFMTFAVYEDFAPYSWLANGEPTGIDVDIARLIAEKIGVEARFNFFAADETVDGDLRNQVWKGPIVSGEVSNIMMHVPYSKDFGCRNEMVVLGGQYFNETVSVAYRKATFPDDPPTTPYFRYNKVGVETDTISDFYLSNFQGGMLLPNIVHYPSYELAFDGMKAGEVDAVMGVKGILEHNLSDGYAIHSPPLVNFTLNNWTLGIAVRMNFREVFYTADGILSDAVADGRIQGIFEKYGVSYLPPKF
jgi:polar amino acid transport system substrate-binding protein